ncbi:MAG: hypothetical protein AB7E52_06660, partial [Bdellovibrionales bacterium]
LSPLRFLPDLLIGVRTNIPHAAACLEKIAVQKAEVSEMASRLRASFLHRYRHLSGQERLLSGKTAFVGQTACDVSLAFQGHFVTIESFKDRLVERAGGRELAYLPHPAATRAHRAKELSFLQTLCPSCRTMEVNLYNLLCVDEDIELLGISSGSLQEAAYFEKKAEAFLPPVCPVRFPGEVGDGYLHLTLDTFTDPEWIRSFLGGASASLSPQPLRRIRPNALRELHNAWWAYADHIVKDNVFWQTVQKPVLEKLGQNVSFVLDCVADQGPEVPAFRQRLGQTLWKWVNGDPIRFEANGTICANGEPTGRYSILDAAHRVIMVSYSNGLWLNRVTLSEDGLKMSGVNTNGASFEVTALSSD